MEASNSPAVSVTMIQRGLLKNTKAYDRLKPVKIVASLDPSAQHIVRNTKKDKIAACKSHQYSLLTIA